MATEKQNKECEIKIHGDWKLITIGQALKYDRNEVLRCPACHGRVSPHKASKSGHPAHTEHYQAHSGCSRGGKGFNGKQTFHPNPQM